MDLSNISAGIEHSEMNRLRLFQQHQVPAKIVTTYYRNNWAAGPGKFGLDLDDVINVFDYFGENHVDFYQTNTVKDYCRTHNYQLVQELGSDGAELGFKIQTHDGRQGLVRADDQSQQLTSVVFAPLGSQVPSVAEGYDTRGFLSSKYYYDRHGQVTKQEVLNEQGQIVCTQVYKGDHQGVALYKLKYHGKKYRFTDLRDFQAFFYDCLNQDYGMNNLFIADRVECVESLPRMQTPAQKAFYIHNQFLNGWQADVLTGGLNFNYEYGLTHNEEFDYIICPSNWEKQEINQRFHIGEKVVAIPGKPSQTDVPQVEFAQRDPHLIIMVARISPEKQVDQALKVLQRVRREDPLAHLEVYGGITYQQEAQKINQTVLDLKLQDAVQFKGVVANMAEVYDRARVLILTSFAEGFPLTLLEASSHGVPMVSYDCRYGPREIVHDNENGYLVPQDAVATAAHKVIKILQNDQLAQKLSQGAYQSAHQFDPTAIWQLWQPLIS